MATERDEPTGTKKDFLNPSQLVEKEHEALKDFFGGEVAVVTPPPLFFETQRVAEGEGFGIFDPLYFPTKEFSSRARFPGWEIKPEEWYWQQIEAGRISEDAAKLGGYWGLFDRSRRPNYYGGKQLFENDPLALSLKKGREEGKIVVFSLAKHIPETSRYGGIPR